MKNINIFLFLLKKILPIERRNMISIEAHVLEFFMYWN